jgi:predicted PurR-regulated permease PerM
VIIRLKMFNFRRKQSAETLDLNIPTRVVVRVVVVVILAFVALAALRQAQHALLLIFTSFFLALALNAPVHWVAQHMPGKRRGSRVAGTAISFFVVIALLMGFLLSVVPPLVRQTTSFIASTPQLIEEARKPDTTIGKYVQKYKLEAQVDKISDQAKDRLGNLGGAAVTSISKFLSSVFTVLTILVLTFMMLIEGPLWIRFVRDLIPDEHQDRADRLARDMYRVVKGYVNGQVVLAVIAACMLLPGLLLLHVSYPAALVVVVFVCGLIPLVGHTIGAIIVTTVALFHSPWSAAIILGYYILYQQIENYIIQPRIQANSTNMSPLLVFASVIVGVSFGGLFGGLVAIPVTGCIRIALLDYLRTKKIIESDTFEEATGHDKPGDAGAKAGT